MTTARSKDEAVQLALQLRGKVRKLCELLKEGKQPFAYEYATDCEQALADVEFCLEREKVQENKAK